MLGEVDTDHLVKLDTQSTTVIDHIGGEIDITYHLEDAVITDLLTIDIVDSDGEIVKQRRYHSPWLVQNERWLDTIQVYVDAAYIGHTANIALYHDPARDRLPPDKDALDAHTIQATVKNGYASFSYQSDTDLDHEDLLKIRRIEGTIYSEGGGPVHTWSERYRFPIGSPPAYYTQAVKPDSDSPRETYNGLNTEITLYLDDAVRVEDSNNPHPTPPLNVYYEEIGHKIQKNSEGESIDVFEIPGVYCDVATVELYNSHPDWTDDTTYQIDGNELTGTYTLSHDGDNVGHTAVVRYFEGVYGRMLQAANTAGNLHSQRRGSESR